MRYSTRGVLAAAAVLVALTPALAAPSHADFAGDLAVIAALPSRTDDPRPVAVVTGSSSARLWTTAAQWLPDHHVVNTGFGGSTMADLAANLQSVVLRFGPQVVYIVEGDNDVAAGVPVEEVLARTRAVLDRIRDRLPGTQVVLVGVKPSLLRWHLRDLYEQLNAGYAAMAARRDHVTMADVWSTLVGGLDRPAPWLYRPDGLHLNDTGQALWAGTVTDPALLSDATEAAGGRSPGRTLCSTPCTAPNSSPRSAAR